jgi:hypothetical protein
MVQKRVINIFIKILNFNYLKIWFINDFFSLNYFKKITNFLPKCYYTIINLKIKGVTISQCIFRQGRIQKFLLVGLRSYNK